MNLQEFCNINTLGIKFGLAVKEGSWPFGSREEDTI